MDTLCKGIKGRMQCVEKLYSEILKNLNGFSIALVGDNGAGKKYVLHLLTKKITPKCGATVLRFIGEQLTNDEKNIKKTDVAVTIEIAHILGFSLSFNKSNDTILKYIMNELKKIRKKIILIIAADFNKESINIKNFIDILVKNKQYIEKQLHKRIFVIISSDDKKGLSDSFKIIDFVSYDTEDLKEYLEEFLLKGLKLDSLNNHDDKLTILYSLTNGNFNLTNLIYRQVLFNEDVHNEELIYLVQKRMEDLKKKGLQDKIDERVIEDIILTSSLCVDYFNNFLLAEVTEKDVNDIDNTIYLGVKENLYRKQSNSRKYEFTSNQIKDELFKFALDKNASKIVKIYNYISKFKPEEYYLRAYYLLLYQGECDANSFSLILLALSKSYLFHDHWMQIKLRDLLNNFSTSKYWKDNFTVFSQAYENYNNGQYEEALQNLDEINILEFNDIVKAEFYRLIFKNYYLLSKCDFRFKKAYRTLKLMMENDIKLNLSDQFYNAGEATLMLRILIDVAPYVLDDENDYSTFTDLYEKSIEVSRIFQYADNDFQVSQYIKNIFYRKAFLFTNPMTANIYYEEAKAFFSRYQIWDELAITLICEAGTMIACGEYADSIENIVQARRLIEEKSIVIPDEEKLYNNLYISEFLMFESTHTDIDMLHEYAIGTIQKLEALIQNRDRPDAVNHVILTNIASLYLYCADIDNYEKIKIRIQKSLKCDNVADIKDESINDFYRYHFALDEIYCAMLKGEWDNSRIIQCQMQNFVPALFKKQENFWVKKNDAISKIITSRKLLNGYEYCNELVEIKQREQYPARFFYRGLMLSDLQYTSFD